MNIINKKDDNQSLIKAIENTVNKLQQSGGGRIKIKHSITETLTLEVSGQKDRPIPIIKDYERTKGDFTVYSEPLSIGENSKLENNEVKVNLGVENFSQEVKKEVEIPVNLGTTTNNSNSNSGENGSSGEN